MQWSLPLGRVAGSEIRIHLTFLLLLMWIGIVHYQGGGAAAATEGVLFVIAVFACVVLHELGHAIAARRYGISTPRITLLPIGRWIEKGSGSGVMQASVPYPLTIEKVARIDWPYHRYDVHRDLTLDYVNYRLSLAKILAEHGHLEKAYDTIMEFRRILPYSRTLPRAECDLLAMLKRPGVEECRAEQKKINETYYAYEIER